MKRLRSLSRRRHQIICPQQLLFQQYRHLNQSFKYGQSEPLLLRFELAAHQHELHGEDSYFMHDNTSFGVADGVGGWNNIKGGNPKEFSRRVMENCKRILDELTTSAEGDGNAYLNSKELLVRASLPVMNDATLLGGSTALIAMLINHNILSVANIGDSRFYLFRHFPDQSAPVLYFISPEQRYSFNAPIQLSPAQYLNKSALAVEPHRWSEYYELPVTTGDIVVFCTDGCSDNLFPGELNQIVVDTFKQHQSNTQRMSEAIAQNMVTAAVDKQKGKGSGDAPFGVPKPDDTTVVVAVCVDDN